MVRLIIRGTGHSGERICIGNQSDYLCRNIGRLWIDRRAGCRRSNSRVSSRNVALRVGISRRQGFCPIPPSRRNAHFSPSRFLCRRPRRRGQLSPANQRSSAVPRLFSDGRINRAGPRAVTFLRVLKPACYHRGMGRWSVSSSPDSFVLAAWITCAALLGCHSDVVPVSGRVTLNGKPLANAVVTFQPLGNTQAPRPAGTGSTGVTDEQGRFSLRMVQPNQRGAVVGDHTVTIFAVSDSPSADSPRTDSPAVDSSKARANPIPSVWRDGSRQFKVPPGGTTNANFDITAAEPPPAKAKSRRTR